MPDMASAPSNPVITLKVIFRLNISKTFSTVFGQNIDQIDWLITNLINDCVEPVQRMCRNVKELETTYLSI